MWCIFSSNLFLVKAAIYARVSTATQDFQRQVDELTSLAKSKGFKDIDVFSEIITLRPRNGTKNQQATSCRDCN
jgi:predicted site-specific integrase-resolvase